MKMPKVINITDGICHFVLSDNKKNKNKSDLKSINVCVNFLIYMLFHVFLLYSYLNPLCKKASC